MARSPEGKSTSAQFIGSRLQTASFSNRPNQKGSIHIRNKEEKKREVESNLSGCHGYSLYRDQFNYRRQGVTRASVFWKKQQYPIRPWCKHLSPSSIYSFSFPLVFLYFFILMKTPTTMSVRSHQLRQQQILPAEWAFVALLGATSCRPLFRSICGNSLAFKVVFDGITLGRSIYRVELFMAFMLLSSRSDKIGKE